MSTFTWVNCGHPHAYLAALDGDVQELEGPIHQPLGAAPDRSSFASSERRLAPGERLILVTDGITQRRTESGMFGIDGLRKALADMQSSITAATATDIHDVQSQVEESLADARSVLITDEPRAA